VAAAGKAVYNLPMYANAALRDPFNPGPPGGYSSGGPTDNVIDIWRAAAPSLAFVSPDIYMREYKKYTAVLDRYSRPDNALFVAETGNDTAYARYVFATLGHQGIGFSPFGMDYTKYSNWPLGAKAITPETIQPFAANYELLAPLAGLIAKQSFEGKVWGASEPDDTHEETLDLGDWRVQVSYGRPQFGMDPPQGNPQKLGGVVIVQLAPDEYLVAGYHTRVNFMPPKGHDGQHFLLEKVQEGRYDENGQWHFIREWNGDQTDYGLNLTSQPQVLRVKLATY
jgi:beta-galactosidase GanA